ncbi:hypothetical protein B9Z55_001079 [Caenorhabditis nigoni]|uniref:DUF19 domain-containing protein n=1 Tax=Caenorhabditis nigoni TaxID=1611254 RepID=A0A2G5VE12_9PELO|nr:hypothetical protein B9Z55_001079 [Caenorhabditis nigoni]
MNFSTVLCAPTPIDDPYCANITEKMKNVKCIDTMEGPFLLKILAGIANSFTKSECAEYGFSVGPFSKCLKSPKHFLLAISSLLPKMTSLSPIFLFFIVFMNFSDVLCAPTPIDDPYCANITEKMKNVVDNLKLEEEKFGNVTTDSMELCHETNAEVERCRKTTTDMPFLLKILAGIANSFQKSKCEKYGFSVGPFSKCIEKTKFELTIIKNTTTADQKCNLSGEEFHDKLSDFVKAECGNEAVNNMWSYSDKARDLICKMNS